MQTRSMPEWPTCAMLLVCYGAWLVLCLLHAPLGWVFFPLAACTVALHSSLQHEALHGHPTRNAALNEALVFPALGLFVPYRIFRRCHLRHHRDESLTDPYDDPESWYRTRRDWAAMPGWQRALLRVNQTLAGRMLIGPALSIVMLAQESLAALRIGNAFTRRAWLLHLVGVALALGFAVGIAGVPPLTYLAAAYGGFSLLMVRTFAEHQAAHQPEARTAIVEAEAPFGLLFLNNNLHAVHHENPRAAWYELPGIYRAERARVLERNRGYRFDGYRAIFARHFLRPKEPVEHPILRRE